MERMRTTRLAPIAARAAHPTREGLTVAAVAVLAALALACGGRETGAAAAAATAAPPLAPAARRPADDVVTATGVVEPRVGAEVRVGSRTSGVVRRLHVRIGDSVRAGELLAELDDRELLARRAEAEAALALAQANVEWSAADLRRKEELRAAGVLAASELDLALRGHRVAVQQEAQARAALDSARTQLGYARIVAPIGGVVASVTTQEGETVAASFAAPTFVTLVDLSRLEVWAYVDETDIGRVHPGQRATFTVDTYPGVEIPGAVSAVLPQAEIRDNVVNYVAVVQFETPAGLVLRPEMTAMVRVMTASVTTEEQR
jgi:RND family efflux transporter MFP subunit